MLIVGFDVFDVAVKMNISPTVARIKHIAVVIVFRRVVNRNTGRSSAFISYFILVDFHESFWGVKQVKLLSWLDATDWPINYVVTKPIKIIRILKDVLWEIMFKWDDFGAWAILKLFLHSFIVCIFMTWREARFMVMTVSLTHLFSQLHIGLELYKYFFETVIGLQRLLSFWYVVQYIVQWARPRSIRKC